MRGKVLAALMPANRTGITPAYAGKSTGLMVAGIFHKDHPRVCGEKMAANRKPRIRKGSPPRMRGKGP